jgi:type VI secretion system protein ImpH
MISGAPIDARTISDFQSKIKAAPYGFDLFYVLRRCDAMAADKPRFGYAQRPQDEGLRITQEPSMTFAPSTLAYLDTAYRTPHLAQFGFGLFGPNGALPLHLTEYARERIRTAGDRTLSSFADIFHHRIGMLFYRAWSDAQATASIDRGGSGSFGRHLGSLAGLGTHRGRERDSISTHAKLFNVGHLARGARNADGLASILCRYFGHAFKLIEYVQHWLVLEPELQTRLGQRSVAAQLGCGAVAGRRVRDAQYHFRLRIGPLPLADYREYLPGAGNLIRLRDWVRQYVGLEYEWDANLVLARNEVPAVRLGGGEQLGWTTWLGSKPRRDDADDLILKPERYAN